MGFISGALAYGIKELITGSQDTKTQIKTIKITEKYRNYLKSNNDENVELEKFIVDYKKFYDKYLKKT